jgi:hypothetical protein
VSILAIAIYAHVDAAQTWRCAGFILVIIPFHVKGMILRIGKTPKRGSGRDLRGIISGMGLEPTPQQIATLPPLHKFLPAPPPVKWSFVDRSSASDCMIVFGPSSYNLRSKGKADKLSAQ